MGIFDTMLTSLVQMDFFQVLFPFLLALAIFYGVLRWATKDKIDKGPVALISIILSFFVMLYAKSIPGLSWMITQLSGSTLAVAVVILFVIVVLGLMGLKLEDLKKKESWVIILAVLVVLYIIFAGVWGLAPGIILGIPWLGGYTDIWTIILFIVIIAIAWHFMTKEGGEEKKEEGGKK